MKKLFCVLTCICVLMALCVMTASAETYNGTCGDNATWVLDTSTGVLTISGDGEMTSYGWSNYSEYIKTAVIEDGITNITDYAFVQHPNLVNVTIPNSVTVIGKNAFRKSDSLANITIPARVKRIDYGAFSACPKLTTITVDSSNPYYCTDEYGVLYTKDMTTLLQCPSATTITEYTIPSSVTRILTFAFSGCKNIASYKVESGNTYFSADDCGSLFNYAKTTLIQYPIGNARTEYDVPNSVKIISSDAFYLCDSITSVTVPNSVNTLQQAVFSGCENLVSVSLGSGIKSIDTNVFMNCSSLESITIPDGITQIRGSVFYNCSSLATVKIPSTVTAISENAFYNCTSLTNITLPEGFQWIGRYAFYNCTSLANITLPEGITQLGVSTFENCSSLTIISIPSSLTSFGSNVFKGCTSLASISVDEDNTILSSDENGVLFSKDKTKLVQYPAGNMATGYIIPDGVTNILNYAFENCTSLQNITIPEGVTAIGNNAFRYCTSLESITIPDSVIQTGSRIFSDCTALKNVMISKGLEKLYGYTFYGCTALESITIPSNIKIINNSVFENCTSLKNVIIPDSVTTIHNSSFRNCTNLTIHGSSTGFAHQYAINHGISFTGHTGAWIVRTPITETVAGEKYRICTFCGAEETAIISNIVLTVGSTTAYLKGVSKTLDVPPMLKNDVVMLPVRFLAENLGATISWNGTTRTVLISGPDATIKITIDSNTAKVNDEEVALETPAIIENNRTYLPVRFVAENLGATVIWDADTQTMTINPVKVTEPPTTDLDGDGVVSVKDVLASIKALLNGTALDNADMDGDGKLTLIDVLRVLKLITA